MYCIMGLHHSNHFCQPRNIISFIYLHQTIKLQNILSFCRLPLNWRTPNGYLLAFTVQIYWMVGGAVVVFSIILPFSGICKIFGAFSMDINKNFTDLNDIVVDCQQKYTVHDRIEIIKRFYAIIEFHSKTKQLSLFALSNYIRFKTVQYERWRFSAELVIDFHHFQNDYSLLFHIQSHFDGIFWPFNTMLMHIAAEFQYGMN